MPTVTVATTDGLVRLTSGGDAEPLHEARIAAAAVADDGWWLADADNQILHVDDRGAVTRHGRVEGPEVTAVLPTGDGVLAGTAGAHLHRIAHGHSEPVDSFESVPGREDWHTPWGGPPAVRSLARGRDGALYVNVHVGGIARSRDGGGTWKPTVDIGVDVHEVVADADSGMVVAAAGAGGLLVSDDAGDSWQSRSDGLHATYCRAVAVAGEVVLVTASAGPHGGGGALYRGALAPEGRLIRCDDGLPTDLGGNIDTGWVAADGGDAAVALPGGAVHVSADAGATWRRLGELGAARPVAVGAPAVRSRRAA